MDIEPVIIQPPVPSPTPLVYNDTIDTSNMTNVVLIDSMVADNKELYDSVNANTFPIIYNYNCKTDDLLALFRQKFPASSIQRIALMFHGRENGEFFAPFMNNKLLFEEGDLADNQTSFSENVSFLISCIKEFHVGHIDFLACSTLMHSNWKSYYALLVSQTSVVVGASNDATGNVQYGGNWVMESTGEDIKQTYFTNSIDYYKYLLTYVSYTLNGINYMCNFTYLNPSTAYVSGASISNVVIPSSINATISGFNANYNVTSIGTYAFQNNNIISTISIPTSVTDIGWGAFESCTIQSLSIPTSVTIIPNYMCFRCFSLNSVTLPNTLTTIRYHAFETCTLLSSITIPNSVTSIEEYVFSGCTFLASAIIGNSLTSIGYNAFQNCSKLPSIAIPSVTSIGTYAFYGCSALASATIGSVASIQDYTFYGCSALASISIPASVTSIGANAFQNCTSLTSVTIQASVISIGANAFQNCASLTSATIPTSVTSIGTYAFASCTSLTSVSIPASVTSIGPQGFDYCTSVTAYSVNSSNNNYSNDASGVLFNKNKSSLVQYPLGNTRTIYNIPSSVTTIADSAFNAATKLTIVSIPASVTTIGSYGFNNCSGLTSVSIPSSVTSIGGYGFYGCSNLNLVYFLQTSSIPIIGTYAFYSIKPISVGKYYTGVSNTSRITSAGITLISPIDGTLTLTSITAFTGNENVLSVISYSNLVTNGNENVSNPPFVYLVQSVTSGSLKIGTTQETATDWNVSTNKTIYAGYNAYWTPPTGVSGTTNAFSVVIQDAVGNVSSPNVQVPVNLIPPTLTSITPFTGNENVLSVISYSNLVTNGNEVVSQTPFVYLVNSVTSGSLTIGATQGTATPWNASTNYTIDASKNAYWTPPTGVSGITNAFMVVVQDVTGAVSSPNVQVQVNLIPPTLTSISPFFRTPDTLSVISYSDLVTNGNEVVSQIPFVYLVNSVTSGSLTIGATQGTATPWNASTNYTIDASKNAYWTPPVGGVGLANAFMVVIRDATGALSSPNVQVQVSLTLPFLTSMTSFTGTPNALSVISYSNLVTNGNEIVYNTPYVYLVQSVTSGSLKIGTTQGTATPWNASTNNTINASNNAYWTPPPGVSGTTNAFSVVIQDAVGNVSSPNVQVQVNLIPPTLTSITPFLRTPNIISVISYSDLVTNATESVSQTPFVYLVNSVTSGSLKIGATQGTATPWNASTNYTIDASTNAYWTPPDGLVGLANAFMVVIRDAVGNVTSPNVQVQVSLTLPFLTLITPFTGTPNTSFTISYTNLQTNGNELVYNTPYVYLVQSVTIDSSLNIGATQGTATPWNASTNNTINASNNAYWTPPPGVSGTTNAFKVVIRDASGNLSSPEVQVQVNLTLPFLTSISNFTGAINGVTIVSYTELVTNGNELVYNTPYVFLVNSVTIGSSLNIGPTQGTATPWSLLNKTIDQTNKGYWTPPTDVSGNINAFKVVIEDDLGNISSPDVNVSVNLIPATLPTLTYITPFTGTENTLSVISYDDLATNGNENVSNPPFVYLVQLLSSGSLSIGQTQETATSWSLINKTIDEGYNAYWTPETGVIGLTNAFMVVIKDSEGNETSPNVQVSVNLISQTLPTLTSMTPFTGDQDTLVLISYTDLQTNGNEVVYNNPYVFLVDSVTRGLLSIGASQETATPWSLSNKTISAGINAYWTPPPGASGTTDAFMVVVQDAVGNESSPPVQVQVILSAAPCFKKGTKILCENDMYIPIENLKIGDLVKTYKHGYQKIIMCAQIMRVHNNLCDSAKNRINQLYTYSRKKNPKLIEDLHLTGGHSLLLNKLTKDESNDMKQIPWTDDEFIVEDKYKLLACFSSKLCIATEQNVEIYHFTLEPPENAKPSYVYGVYANGILAESCSKGAMEEALGKNNM